MRFIYTTLLLLAIFFIPLQGNAQHLELQGVGGVDCADNLFHFTVQAQSDGPNVSIGSFSVFFTFDETIMSFNSFNSLNFDGSDLCDAGTTAWATPKHGTIPGSFNMNFTLMEGQEASSCPILDNNWVDIAEITFDISDFPTNADLSFVLEHIHFNSNVPNNGNSTIPVTFSSININNCLGDYDNDGIADADDNCPFVPNPGQEDLNNNDIGDICEASCDLVAYTAGDVLICSGDMITIAASGIGGVAPYTFEWDSGETTEFISVSETVTTAHYVTVTDSEGCVDKDTVNIIVSDMNILPGLAVRSTVTWAYVDTIYDGDIVDFATLPDSFRLRSIVEGTMESMSLALTGEMEYTRNDNNPGYDFFFSGTNGTSILEPGSYTMNLSAYSEDNQTGLNCANREINFTIVSDCEIDLGVDTSICANDLPFILDATSAGVEPITYAWSTGESTATISVNPTEETIYVVTVTDANGCRIVDHINIDVLNSGTVDQFAILDVGTGNIHSLLNDGDVLLKDDLPSPYAIIVLTTGVDGSIDFEFTTSERVYDSYDNTEPFYVSVDGIDLDLPIGDYSVLAHTFENDWIWGASCSSLEISFTIESCPVVEMADDFIFCSAISGNPSETITPIVTGDTSPYSYAWSDATNADHIVITPPAAGTTSTYYVSVTNSYPSCETVDSIVVYSSDIDITDMAIVDLDNGNAVYKIIHDGDIYNKQDLPANYNIEAYTTGAVGSVRLELSGDLSLTDTDSNSPYRLNSDNVTKDFPPGNYTMTSRVYTLPSREGPYCEEMIKSFTIVDCPSSVIAGTEYDNCEAHSKIIPTTDTWTDVTDGNGHIVASFKSNNLVDLGTVTVDVQRSLTVGTMNFPSGGNVKLLPRHFHFASSNFASGTNFPADIDVRIYFTDEELELFNAADIGDYGFSNYVGHDLALTHYYGNNQDCDYSNNIISPSNSERLPTNHQIHNCNGQYFEFSVNHFSEFIIHEPTGVLPIELLYFTGKLMNEKTILNWETVFEENVNGFEIERSNDTKEWKKLGFITANNSASNYEFWDNQPLNGVNYYRLKSLDLDGTYEYSNIVIITLDRKENIIGDVSPNPISRGNEFILPVNIIQDMDVKIQITNQLGQIIFLEDKNISKGINELSFDTDHYSNGFYTIQITLDNEQEVRKFEVIR